MINMHTTVTFPAVGRHRPLAGTSLYCLMTEANGCEQLASGRYWRIELTTFEQCDFRF